MDNYKLLCEILNQEFISFTNYKIFTNEEFNKLNISKIKDLAIHKSDNYIFNILGPMKYYMNYDELIESTKLYINTLPVYNHMEFKDIQKNISLFKLTGFDFSRLLGKQYLDKILNIKNMNEYTTPNYYIVTDILNYDVEILFNRDGPKLNIIFNSEVYFYSDKIIGVDCGNKCNNLKKIGYIDIGDSQAKKANVLFGHTSLDLEPKKYIVDTEYKSFIILDKGLVGMMKHIDSSIIGLYKNTLNYFIYDLLFNSNIVFEKGDDKYSEQIFVVKAKVSQKNFIFEKPKISNQKLFNFINKLN